MTTEERTAECEKCGVAFAASSSGRAKWIRDIHEDQCDPIESDMVVWLIVIVWFPFAVGLYAIGFTFGIIHWIAQHDRD